MCARPLAQIVVVLFNLNFDFQIRIVKLMFTIEIEQHYKTLWRLADVID